MVHLLFLDKNRNAYFYYKSISCEKLAWMQRSPLCPTPRLSLNSNGRRLVADSSQRQTGPANRHWFDMTALSPPAFVCHQSMFQNLWNLWKRECGNSRDVNNLALVLSPRLPQRAAAIRGALWTQRKLAWHPVVRREASQKSRLVQSERVGTRKQMAKRNTGAHRPKRFLY